MANDKELQILTDLLTDVRNDVVHSMQEQGRVATGNTIRQLEIEQTGSKVILYGPDYIDILERGRGPTSPDAQPADPPVVERIKEWIAAKGLDLNPYAVTNKIHKQGYTGRPGLLSQPLSDDNLEKHADQVAQNLADLIITQGLKI